MLFLNIITISFLLLFILYHGFLLNIINLLKDQLDEVRLLSGDLIGVSL